MTEDANRNPNLEQIIANAQGEKPFSLQQTVDNEMVERAREIIAGKRNELEAQLSITRDEAHEEDPTDDEINDLLNDVDLDAEE